MIRSIVLHDIPITHIAAMERWYYRDHSPEIVRRYGPWSRRHDSYLPVAAPDAARAFGFFNWRLTEGWWHELPLPGPRGTLAFTLPPVFPRVAACFTPWQPTEDFRGGSVQSTERPILRWVVLHRYPAGVERAAGDRWFLETHVPELLGHPALWRCFSYRTVKDAPALPGTWPEHAHPPAGLIQTGWDRVTELWFDGFDAWRQAIPDRAAALTPPPWAPAAAYPFLEPGRDLVSTFVLERPTDEFLRDARSYL